MSKCLCITDQSLSLFFFFLKVLFFLIGVQLLYNVVLVSAAQQCESAIYICMCVYIYIYIYIHTHTYISPS